MKPFMNRGWEHYENIQNIMFSTAARGSHIFRPTLALPTTIATLQNNDDEPSNPSKLSQIATMTSMAIAMATASDSIAAVAASSPLMDVDGSQAAPTLSDNNPHPTTPHHLSSGGSASKRTHSVMSLSSDFQFNDGSTEITTPSNLSSKKQAKDRSQGSHDSRLGQSRALGKVTQASAMVGMQSQISRLTDVFEKSMATPDDGLAAKRSLAIAQLQDLDDGLTVGEKVKMISKFQKDISIAQTYLDLVNGEIRQAWLRAELDD